MPSLPKVRKQKFSDVKHFRVKRIRSSCTDEFLSKFNSFVALVAGRLRIDFGGYGKLTSRKKIGFTYLGYKSFQFIPADALRKQTNLFNKRAWKRNRDLKRTIH